MSDIRVSFFGDSMVAGVGDSLGGGWVQRVVADAFAAGTPLTAYNLGIRQETSADVLARWQTEITPRLTNDADCRVVFSVGANDTTQEDGQLRVTPANSVQNLASIITQAKQASLPLFVVGPPPVNDDAQQQRITSLSQQFSRVADQHRTPYVHIADDLYRSAIWRHELDAGDGAHPGTRGYDLMADLIKPSWRKWLATAQPLRAR